MSQVILYTVSCVGTLFRWGVVIHAKYRKTNPQDNNQVAIPMPIICSTLAFWQKNKLLYAFQTAMTSALLIFDFSKLFILTRIYLRYLPARSYPNLDWKGMNVPDRNHKAAMMTIPNLKNGLQGSQLLKSRQ